jgi:P2 family phage contractile tail tube protein
MALKINKVFDANVYVNNSSKHGQASEVTCPDVQAVMTDYASLGMIGSAEFFNGVDKMEATIKWTYPDNEAKIALANFMKPVDIMVRSSKAQYVSGGISGEIPVVIYLRGYSTKHPGGGFTPKTDVELESTLSVLYYKEEVDGEEILEIDVLNNIYKVNGEDLLAERRQNLGI